MDKYYNQYFILSSSCALTKGAKRTLIQDFQRSNADFVPNDYFSLCNLLNRHKISDVANGIEEGSLPDYYQFVDFMIEKEYAFLSDNLQTFPEISSELYEGENEINDAIIDIDENNIKVEKLDIFLKELKKLHCTDLQVKVYKYSDLSKLHYLLNKICNHIFYYVELHLSSSEQITYEDCCNIILNYPSVTNIYLYGATSNRSLDYNENTVGCYPLKMGTVYYVAANLDNNNCGCISDYSKIYRDAGFYKMSHVHNSCLYKKVSLDKDGYVRNCPSMLERYDLSDGLEKIIKTPAFKKYWNITKKEVESCKDCEFRYNCLDCRAHTKNGLFGKPITCKYNPFIAKKRVMNIVRAMNEIGERLKRFPCYIQFDMMDCGPAALASIASYYGKEYGIPELRGYCFLTKDGVSLLGIEDAARNIGFETLAVKTSVPKLYSKKPFPCILHWDNVHFVVLYNIRKSIVTGQRFFYISDPSYGRVRVNEDEFCSHWCGADGEGVALLMTPGEKFYEMIPKYSKSHYKKNFLSFYKTFRNEYSILFWGMLFSSIFALIFPFLTQSLIDIGIGRKDIHIVFVFLLAQLFLFIGSTLITIVRNWTLLYSNSIINIDIIHDFLAKIIRLPFKFFDTKQLGDFTARINDHNRIQTFLTSSSITVIFSFLTFIVYFILLTYYDVKILLVYIGITAIAIAWSVAFVNKEKKIDYSRYRTDRETQQNVYEIINGISEIKLNGTEEYELGCWKDSQVKLFGIDVDILKLSQLESIGYESFNKLKDIVVVFMAAYDVIIGTMTLGTLLAISYIIGSLNQPISQIIEFIRSLQYAKLSYERLTDVQALEDEDKNTAVKISNDTFKIFDGIHLKHVDFQYYGPRSPKVINDMTLDIPFGKTTAIVGESGSGKTTLMKLLLKFYDKYDGTILYGNAELKDISARSLREHCGVVMQDGYIFSDTLERNIATGKQPIEQEKLKKAIDIAQLTEFVENLPQGLKTQLGTGGNGISGGQRQRILIARAVYQNPPFVLFDEATSSLDAKTENKIYHDLDKFLTGRTVLKIAHRLSTVKNADQIIVLHEGKITERGTHDELIAQKGTYYELVKNQLDLSN